MAKLTKKRKAALEKINSEMTYEVDIALGLVKDHATAKGKFGKSLAYAIKKYNIA